MYSLQDHAQYHDNNHINNNNSNTQYSKSSTGNTGSSYVTEKILEAYPIFFPPNKHYNTVR